MLKKSTQKFIIVLFSCLLFSCKSNQQKKFSVEENSKMVNDFFERKFNENIDAHPEFASNLGLKTNNDKWNDHSESAYFNDLAFQKSCLDSLRKFDLENLDEQTKLSVRLFEEQVKRAEAFFPWRHHDYIITQMGGIHNDLPSFLINVHAIDSVTDARAYIARLNKLETVFSQTIVQLKIRDSLAVFPPKFTMKYVREDLENFIKSLEKTDASNVLWDDFQSKVKKLPITENEKIDLQKECGLALQQKVKPAYQLLLNEWKGLEAKVSESNGVWNLPDGDKYYKYCLEEITTTNKTADEIFDTGLQEVARIQNEMRTIMKQVNFTSDSLQLFFEFVRSSPQFKYTNDTKGREQLLADCNSYLGEVKDNHLKKLFNHIPKSPLVVMAVEKFREKSSGGAFYENPSLDGSRPGRFFANLYNMDDEPKYQMEALCYHEGVPGHHMQIALAQEMDNVPKFRRYGGNVAYIEGWALYSELVPKEIGLYKDPYSDFGRLSMEIFRAARLVVDVGIHQKKWSKEKALKYFLDNTANAKGDCEKEIERYFLWPAQATGYKTGMLKILELRAKAKKELGEKFDIKKFHDVILMNGAVPLNVLEELVNNYIVSEKK